jgi:RNA polymerase sigma factor (sigma-70 family)
MTAVAVRRTKLSMRNTEPVPTTRTERQLSLWFCERRDRPLELQRVGVIVAERVEQTDADLIGRSLLASDAFGVLYERHFSVVYRFIGVRAERADVADLTAATFEIAFRDRAGYNLARADARPWLLGIALNLVRRCRREHGRGVRVLSRLFVRGDLDDRALDRVAASVGVGALRELLVGMREDDKDLLLLYACLDFTYEECAEALGVAVGTVRSRLHRLRRPLRARLEALEERAPEAGEVPGVR